MRVLEHITTETVERYRAWQLSAVEITAVQTHAAVCAVCRARLAQAVDVDAAFANLRGGFTADALAFDDEPEHLPYEQLAAYMDGSLDDIDREIADSHLSFCQSCAGDLADLQRYHAIAAAPVETEVPARATLWQRLSSFVPVLWDAVPGAMAATIIAAALLGAWFVMRTNTNSRDEIAVVEPTTENNPTIRQQGTPNANATNTGNATNSNDSSVNSPDVNTQAAGQNAQTIEPRPSPTASPLQPANDNIAPAPPALQFALNDGGKQVTFDEHGNLHGLESLPTSVRQVVRRSLQTQRVETPRTLDNLAGGGSGVLMSGEAMTEGVPFALVTPIGKVVQTDRPALRWRPRAGAASYTVTIVNSSFKPVAQSPGLSATEWRPTTSLPRGMTYFWQVTALMPDGTEVTSPTSPAPQAKFRVLDESTNDNLKLLEKANTDSPLARGVLYAKAGLLDEAEAEFNKLVKENPRSPLARKLLRSVQRKK